MNKRTPLLFLGWLQHLRRYLSFQDFVSFGLIFSPLSISRTHTSRRTRHIHRKDAEDMEHGAYFQVDVDKAKLTNCLPQKQAQQKAETDSSGAKKKKVTAAQLRVQKGNKMTPLDLALPPAKRHHAPRMCTTNMRCVVQISQSCRWARP